MQTRFLLWKMVKLLGKGTHRELMKNCEVYQQIAKSQMSEKELDIGEVGTMSSKKVKLLQEDMAADRE